MKITTFLSVILLIFALAVLPASAAEKKKDANSKGKSQPKAKSAPQKSGEKAKPAPAPKKGESSKTGPKSVRARDNKGDKKDDGGKKTDGGKKNNGGSQNKGGHRDNGGSQNQGGHNNHGGPHNSGGQHSSRGNHGHFGHPSWYFAFNVLAPAGRSWIYWHDNWDDWYRSWDRWDRSWDANWYYRAGEAAADKNYIQRSLKDLVDRAHDEDLTPIMRQICHIRDGRSWEVDLPVGHYVVMSTGGLNIDDLDLRVIDKYGEEIAEDNESNASPALWFDIYERGTVRIETEVWKYRPGYYNDYVCILLCKE